MFPSNLIFSLTKSIQLLERELKSLLLSFIKWLPNSRVVPARVRCHRGPGRREYMFHFQRSWIHLGSHWVFSPFSKLTLNSQGCCPLACKTRHASYQLFLSALSLHVQVQHVYFKHFCMTSHCKAFQNAQLRQEKVLLPNSLHPEHNTLPMFLDIREDLLH